MTMHKGLHPRDDVVRQYVLKKREEEHLLLLKTALLHRYNDPNITMKSAEEDWLQPSEKYWQHKDQNGINRKIKMGRKHSVDVLSD